MRCERKVECVGVAWTCAIRGSGDMDEFDMEVM